VISLKKYLDMEISPARTADPVSPDLLQLSLEAYRTALRSMGDCGARACPPLGSNLQQNLEKLAAALLHDATSSLLTETTRQANQQLQQWGDKTVEYFNARTAEVKDLLLVLARMGESMGDRDQKYASHFNQFTTRLQTISNLEDLTHIRTSLLQQACELKTYVDQMEHESHQVLRDLQTEVSTYATRLQKVEELALRDALTGLANRHNVEQRIEERIARGQAFCVVMLDLNRLKLVNDEHGHLAGDNLLQQFAQEVRSSLRSSDLVGRWGGDEFLIVMDSDATAANSQIARMQKWVFGDYTIRPGKGSGEVKVKVDASVGLAQWQPGENIRAVIERADAQMYKQKGLARSASNAS
jgi:diguanylate cyclase (GGDEF)-like protein